MLLEADFPVAHDTHRAEVSSNDNIHQYEIHIFGWSVIYGNIQA